MRGAEQKTRRSRLIERSECLENRRPIFRLALLCAGIGRHGVTGSSRYVTALGSGLSAVGENDFQLVMSSPSALSRNQALERVLLASWAASGLPSVSSLLRDQRPTLAHSTESLCVPRGGKVPLVVTVHDMCALRRPDLVSHRLALLKRLSWRRSRTWDAVIVPSRSTAVDVIDAGVSSERVFVIRHGMDPCFIAGPQDPPASFDSVTRGAPFLLAVCPTTRKKGADTLLEAWTQVASSVDGLLLWVKGARPEDRGVQTRALRPGQEKLRVLGAVSDEELATLYRAARALVVPSRWEGYSFPVAEALACGTPVIASDIPAHREFGPSGVTLFPTGDVATLTDCLVAGLQGELSRESRVFPGWEECARNHLRVFKQVLSN